jgi:hypothetical protein
VEVRILDNDDNSDLFEEGCSVPLALDDDEEVQQQLARISPGILGVRVASVWKVLRQRRKVKQVVSYVDLPQTPARLFAFLRGHATPDYLLIVPESHSVFRSSSGLLEGRRERLGIVSVAVTGAEGVVRTYRVVGKDSLEDFKVEEEKRLGRLGHFEDKDRFVYDWTDHCSINFD